MRVVAVAGVLVAALSACSTSDSSASGCKYATQCVTAVCDCNLKGHVETAICLNGTCETVDQICSEACKTSGGVQSQAPALNVVGSAECNAFCDRWSKDCGGPCAIQACDVALCDAATKASLQCRAAKGIGDCENFLFADTDCDPYNFAGMCGDAGVTDAAGEGGAGDAADAGG